MSEYFKILGMLFRSNYGLVDPKQLKSMMQKHIKRSMLDVKTYDGNMDKVDHVIEMWRNKALFHTTVDEEEKKMLVCL